jgi:hypothetical protein
MAVYPRPDRNPFRNLELDRDPFGMSPNLRSDAWRQAAAKLREREAAREGVIDLVEINGVWQVPSR